MTVLTVNVTYGSQPFKTGGRKASPPRLVTNNSGKAYSGGPSTNDR